MDSTTLKKKPERCNSLTSISVSTKTEEYTHSAISPNFTKKKKHQKRQKKGKTLEEQKQSLKLLAFFLSSCFKDEMVYSFNT